MASGPVWTAPKRRLTQYNRLMCGQSPSGNFRPSKTSARFGGRASSCARGLRVITELVINHTSDQHPWFQRARKAKPGSAARN